jgi:anti-anti-sigma factor
MAKVICKKNNNAVLIEMSGDLHLQHVQKLKQFLLSVSESSAKECIIDVSSVSSVDLSFVEMFLSFSRTMKSAGKSVLFYPVHDETPVHQIISAVGMQCEFTFAERGPYGF